ncbi:tyrosine-type recombinase/integrase [Tautonia sociabilis]|uniref:Tyr recombinase domain-containing protein n=1 Tax=Tautonia sociabilis TaxID=2080755 RepID=A0A432MJL8_9BACT|nr:tyrosine-type recombinase/integrase [Tautonia sociabilis]RUL87602.1 hypothetical protein TsocGM_11370 [Tautonia sociabilis]
MPAKYELTWDASNHRWRVQHAGRRYVISCRQLSKWAGQPVPSTKEGSYRVANAWWDEKRAEIDGHRGPHPHADTIALLEAKRDWARRHGQPDTAASLTEKIETTRRLRADDDPDPEWPGEVIAIARSSGIIIPDDLDPSIARMIFGEGSIWRDRLQRDATTPLPDDLTIGGQVATWTTLQQTKVKAGEISPARHANDRIALHHFRDFLGTESPVGSIDETKWTAWYGYVLSKIGERENDPKAGWSRDYSAIVFKVGKAFVKHLYQTRLLDHLPRNLDAYRIGRTTREIEVMTTEDVRRLLDMATDRVRLYLLLAMNTGMTQKDLSDLQSSEVDLKAGTITRKRSKTHKEKDVPTVTYQLWPATLALLSTFKAEGNRALVTSSGRPLVDKRIVDGRLRAKDSVATAYKRLAGRCGVSGSFSVLRATSSTLLEEFDPSGKIGTLFLGHSPRSIKDKHYSRPHQIAFDEALAWLGRKYGVTE